MIYIFLFEFILTFFFHPLIAWYFFVASILFYMGGITFEMEGKKYLNNFPGNDVYIGGEFIHMPPPGLKTYADRARIFLLFFLATNVLFVICLFYFTLF